MTRSFALPLYGLLALGFFGSACSGGDDDDTTVVPTVPVIDSFTVDRDFVQANDTVVVSWKVSRANAVKITQNDGRGLPAEDFIQVEASKPYEILRDTEFVIVATNDLGETAMATLMVTVDGIRIEAFTASETSVNRRDLITLSWTIAGEVPTSVTIEDDQGNSVYDDDEAMGSVDVRVEPPAGVTMLTYTLTAEGATGTKTAAIDITVESSRPTITRFAAVPDDVVEIGEEVNLTWMTTADQVQVLQDGDVVRPWTASGAASGTLQRPVNGAMSVFTLQARNEIDVTDVVEESITVMGIEVPIISTFELTPVEYTEQSTVATITWEVMNAETLELRIGNTAVAGFPGDQASGTFDFPVSGQPRVRLLATNAVRTVERSQTIMFGYDDPEPNDDAASAIGMLPNGVGIRGTISVGGDIDWYRIEVPQGALLSATAGFVPTMAGDVCSFDTILRVFTSTGAEIGFNDNGPGPIAPCSQINPLSHAFADGMDAGTYYLAVSGTGTVPNGQYTLEVELLAPPPAPVTFTATPVGTPVWNVGGTVMWEGPVGMTGEAVPPEIEDLFAGFHLFEGFALISVLTSPAAPMPRADYSSLLPLFMGVTGRTVTTTFPTTALLNGNAIYLGFTIFPGAGAPTGPSFDAANGPIIPNAVFPITVSIDVSNGATDYVVPDDFDLPSYAQYAANGLPAVPGAGDGDSHRHIVTLIADIVALMPGGALAGSYTWTYQLRDTSGAGYDITVPFTVQ